MPDSAELAALARLIKRAQDGAHQIAPLSSRMSDFDVSCAYTVADLVHRGRVQEGAVPVGRKIGFTNAAMWSTYGVGVPIWAHVYDTTVVRVSGGRARCNLSRFTEPKIEPEIVLHFRTSPPPGGELSALLASIDWIAHGFEIVQSHFSGWKFRVADTVADSGLHGTLLVGEPQSTDRLGPDLIECLERFSLSLFKDDTLCEVGVGSNVLGSPLRAIAHLTAVLAEQPQFRPIQAGELVTTGSITTAHSVEAGECWRTEVHGIGLPGLSVEFTR